MVSLRVPLLMAVAAGLVLGELDQRLRQLQAVNLGTGGMESMATRLGLVHHQRAALEHVVAVVAAVAERPERVTDEAVAGWRWL
jgi:hypothetical protein